MNQVTASAAPVIVERDAAVVTITLNRPDTRNAVNQSVSDALGDALAASEADRGVRAIILTGTGLTFSAGADLKELSAGRSVHPSEHRTRGFAGMVQHFVNTPVVAAVNGDAFGGGAELVMACDLAVAAETARFGLPEVKRGLIAAAGGLIRLPRQIPHKRALEMALTGEPITAAQALEWGLVNYVVPSDDVLTKAHQLASAIAANAPLAVQASKRLIHQTAGMGSDWSDEPWRAVRNEARAIMNSRDAAEGPRAFAEKRPPEWAGE